MIEKCIDCLNGCFSENEPIYGDCSRMPHYEHHSDGTFSKSVIPGPITGHCMRIIKDNSCTAFKIRR